MLKATSFKNILIISIIALQISSVYCQQTPQYTMQMYNIYQSNVAFAGIEDNLNVFGYYRTQWQGVTGNPKQYQINATLPMHILNGGIGAKIESFENGAESVSRATTSYNWIGYYRNLTLSGGAAVGLSQLTLDGSKYITPEGIYTSTPDHQDPILTNQKTSNIYPEYSLATFVSHPLFDVGLSFNNIIPSSRVFDQFDYTQSKNLEIIGIYYLPLRGGYLLEPGIIVRTNFDDIQTQVFATVKRGNIFGGIQVRGYSKNSIDSASLMSGVKFNDRYTISYSFDVLLNTLKNVSDGTHEIMLKYSLQREINTGLPPSTMYSPRNL